MKFDFRHGKIHCEKPFEQRCANYDNLSYLIMEKISSKKEVKKISSCKDYFAASTRTFSFRQNEQSE